MRSFIWVVLAACGGGGDGTDVDGGMQVDARMIDAPTGPTITKTYQQGVDGYTATKSVGISTYGGLGNIGEYNANGMTFADGINDWCTGTDIPSGTYSEVWLIRFESLDIPAGSQVISASFSMHGYGDGGSDRFFAGRYMAVPWYGDTPSTCAGCSNSPVGWRYANTSSTPWGAMGAAAEGTDTLTSKTFRVPEAGFVDTDFTPTEYTTALDTAVVQQWVDGTNHGLRIVAGVDNIHMGYVQAQRDGGRPESMRPKLSITFANPNP